MANAKVIQFEAEVEISPQEMVAVASPNLTDTQEIEQAVQNRIGHTGAIVTCVFEID